MTDYTKFFNNVTGNAPYHYQASLASLPCESRLISIPTGLGKTAAIVLAWLHNRVVRQNPDWPRRLVYCLPMRTLVEQTKECCGRWLDKLELNNDVSINILMGGENDHGWDIHPEKPTILIGTQDMLLSRALNRGYGMSRTRWPMHFGLLNNDALWVLDETQLMGVGVCTSAQLEGFRTKIGTALGCVTWWASATLDTRLLQTIDHANLPPALTLSDEDKGTTAVKRRLHATKRLTEVTELKFTADSAKPKEAYLQNLAALVLKKHQENTLTLIILNRVDRAKALYEHLKNARGKTHSAELLLVHSRFRQMERTKLTKELLKNEIVQNRIIIATQAVEAGIDLSSRTLITELAPWSSLVQRFGRCNRSGEFNDAGGADIFWINLEADDAKNAVSLALPYLPESLTAARQSLRKLADKGASSDQLSSVIVQDALPEHHIIRRKDLVELFDTTPDLAGLDIDVGRYIRDGEDRDVQVFWRKDVEKVLQKDTLIKPQREELVSVSIGDFTAFANANKESIWLWNVLDGEWQRLRGNRIAPGQVFLIEYSAGGYSEDLGWTGKKSKDDFPVYSSDSEAKPAEAPRSDQSHDDESLTNNIQSLEYHTQQVMDECAKLCHALALPSAWTQALLTATRWHDLGKTHACFQEFITTGQVIDEKHRHEYLAKASPPVGTRHRRPYFRHELASALAWLQAGGESDVTTESLIAYLIASHHGKVRLSIRSMPGEMAPTEVLDPQISDDTSFTPPEDHAALFARGIWDGDLLVNDSSKTLKLEGCPDTPVRLDLSCMQMGTHEGNHSWTERILSLRDSKEHGVFRLAFLETIMRSSDAVASTR